MRDKPSYLSLFFLPICQRRLNKPLVRVVARMNEIIGKEVFFVFSPFLLSPLLFNFSLCSSSTLILIG